VLGVLPGIVGTIQATEALKLVTGIGTTLLNRLLLYDALQMRFREIKLRRDPKCPVCGEQPTITKLIDYEQFCGTAKAGETSSEIMNDEVTVQDMKAALENPALNIKVVDVREPSEYQIASVKGATLLPLSQLPQRFGELDKNQPYYLHCKGGVRSLQAVNFLKQQGFKEVKSVKGGILAWSTEIDPSVPKY
jgi:adenylyltransferase/sulfurtransferase